MKKQLSILGAVVLAASMTVTAVADDGITLWPNVTTPKVVPQTADLDTYGKHVGRSQPVTTSTQPVVDKAMVDFVPEYSAEELKLSINSKTWNNCIYMATDGIDLIAGTTTTVDAAAKTVTIAK